MNLNPIRSAAIEPPELPRAAVPTVTVLALAVLLWRMPATYSFSAYAFAGAALVFVAREPAVGEMVFGAVVGTILTGALLFLRPAGSWPASAATAFGSVAMILSAFHAGTASPNARDAGVRRLASVVTMPAFVAAASVFLERSAGWHLLTFDGILASVDRSFGVDASSLVGIMTLRSSVLWWTCKIVYDSLPLALCAVAAVRYRRLDQTGGDRILLATVLAGTAAQLISQIVPACGPRFFWGAAFPTTASALRAGFNLVTIPPTEFRNAFPSLHMTGALFVAWSAKPFGGTVRTLAWLYAALTVLATLGSGEHYLVDLIVAAPFALAIYLAVQGRELRRVLFLCALVGAWTLLVRERALVLVPIPGVAVALAVVSVVATFVPLKVDADSFALPPVPVGDDAAVNERSS